LKTPGSMDELTTRIRQCRICAEACPSMPNRPNPVFQASARARVLIAGQAPGNLADKTRKPFNDPSGRRLRAWLGVSEAEFYDAEKFAILPMGFCFPGYDAKGGDLPPRKECAPAWRDQMIAFLPQVRTRILIGGYAQSWHLGKQYKASVTKTVQSWTEFAPDDIPLPHPSWRNNAWLTRHPWFETDLLPVLQRAIRQALSD
jgi:uracil-DNA glycosylase